MKSIMTTRSPELVSLEVALKNAVQAEIDSGQILLAGELRMVDTARAALDEHLIALHAATCEHFKAHKHSDGRTVVLPFFDIPIAAQEKLRALMVAEHTRINGAGRRDEIADRRFEVAEELIEAITAVLEASAKRPAKPKKKD